MLEIILKLLNENPEVAINLVHGYIEKYKPVTTSNKIKILLYKNSFNMLRKFCIFQHPFLN